MSDERKNLFSRGDFWAVLFLLSCMLIGSAMMIFQKHNRRLPPELVIETVKSTATAGHKYTAASGTASQPSQNHLKLNLNTAPADSLELLPGIGPKYAALIAEYRQNNGPFESVQELAKIPGIGPKTVNKLSQYLTLE